jgi:hypothetical protein
VHARRQGRAFTNGVVMTDRRDRCTIGTKIVMAPHPGPTAVFTVAILVLACVAAIEVLRLGASPAPMPPR